MQHHLPHGKLKGYIIKLFQINCCTCMYVDIYNYTRVRRWVTEPMQEPIIETQHSIY